MWGNRGRERERKERERKRERRGERKREKGEKKKGLFGGLVAHFFLGQDWRGAKKTSFTFGKIKGRRQKICWSSNFFSPIIHWFHKEQSFFCQTLLKLACCVFFLAPQYFFFCSKIFQINTNGRKRPILGPLLPLSHQFPSFLSPYGSFTPKFSMALAFWFHPFNNLPLKLSLKIQQALIFPLPLPPPPPPSNRPLDRVFLAKITASGFFSEISWANLRAL